MPLENNHHEPSQYYDLFISHSSEDKDSIARPLYQALTSEGFTVWFDEAELRLGDSLRRKIDDGLARCRYGVVILSPSFLERDWPKRELDGLVARETNSGQTAILPVWHNLSSSLLLQYSPTLSDRLAVRSCDGISRIVDEIRRSLIQAYQDQQDDSSGYLSNALGLQADEQTLPPMFDEDIVTTLHPQNGPSLHRIEELVDNDFTTILLLHGDEGINLRRLAYWVANLGMSSKLNKFVMAPVHIKLSRKCDLNDEIKQALHLKQQTVSNTKIRQHLAERKLLPIVECLPAVTEDDLISIFNGLTSSFTIFIWHDSTLPCLSQILHTRIYHTSFLSNKYDQSNTSGPVNNLPQKDWDRFVGRLDEQRELKHLMSLDYHHNIVTVKGMSGVGKTELILKVAHELANPRTSEYDFILFFTAKKHQLSSCGRTQYLSSDTESFKTLDDLCEKISRYCGHFLTHLSRSEQEERLEDFLNSGKHKLLILIDNYETIEPQEQQRIHNFFRNLSKNAIVKIVINARVWHPVDLCLEPLASGEALSLTSIISDNLELSAGQINNIVLFSQHLPLAIIWIISLIREGNSLDQIIDNKIKQYDKNGILEYMFQDLLDILRATDLPTFNVFQVMSITHFPLSEDDIQRILKISDSSRSSLHDSLKKLVEYSLCTSQLNRYSLKSLAREYGVSTLRNEPVSEAHFRNSLKAYILCLAEDNGGDDWGSYRDKYEVLNSYWDNIKELFSSLQASWKDDFSCSYLDAKKLWKMLQRFTYLYGYWSVREEWTKALIDEAQVQGDNIFCAELLAANGWIFLMREGEVNVNSACNNFEEALIILRGTETQDTDYRLYNDVTLTILLNLAAAKVRQRAFMNAKEIFYMFLSLWRKTTTVEQRKNCIENRIYNRFYIRYLLYRGEYFYRRNLPWRAERYYHLVDNLCQKIEWTRFSAKANERIAFLKIKSGDPRDARIAMEKIRHWAKISKQNGDKRRVAFFMKDEALLWNRFGNHTAAKQLAKYALKEFEKLEMAKRVVEMNEFISSLPCT